MNDDEYANAPTQHRRQNTTEASTSSPRRTYPPRKILPETPNGGTEKHHVAWYNPRTLDTHVQDVYKQATNLAREQPLEATRVVLKHLRSHGNGRCSGGHYDDSQRRSDCGERSGSFCRCGDCFVTSVKAVQDQKKRVRPRVQEPKKWMTRKEWDEYCATKYA